MIIHSEWNLSETLELAKYILKSGGFCKIDYTKFSVLITRSNKFKVLEAYNFIRKIQDYTLPDISNIDFGCIITVDLTGWYNGIYAQETSGW